MSPLEAGVNPVSRNGWGLVRNVHQGVQYNNCTAFPSSVRWERSTRNNQQFFLEIQKEILDNTVSLRQFSQQLQAGPPSSQLLGQLDHIARSLVETTRTLHEDSRELGMMTGDNILWLGNSTLLLLDHGFHSEDAAFVPEWIREPPPDHILWELPIERQQKTALKDPHSSSDRDVAILIRIFQGMMIGKWQKELVTGEQLRNQYHTESTRLWHELRTLLEHSGEDRLTQLQSIIEEHPLSSHFKSKGREGPGEKPKNRALLWASLALLIFVIVAGGLFVAQIWPFDRPEEPPINNPPHPPTVEPTKPQSPESSELAKAIAKLPPVSTPDENPTAAKLPEIVKDLADQADRLEELDGMEASEDEIEAENERAELDKRREVFFDAWEAAFLVAKNQFEKDASRQEGFDNLIKLRDVILKVNGLSNHASPIMKEKGQRCLELLRTLKFNKLLPKSFWESVPFS